MNQIELNAIYPNARVDKNFNVIEANPSLYKFMGESVMYPLCKLIHDDDWNRLKPTIDNCAAETELRDYARIKDTSGEYKPFLITVRKCADNESAYVQLFDMSKERQNIIQTNRQLALSRDYLTLVGDIYSEYHPADDSFRMFWLNNEQTIELYHTTLTEWKNEILTKKLVDSDNENTFSSVCESMKKADDILILNFFGSIFTNGERTEKYRIKIMPRQYNEERIILGLWSVLNQSNSTIYETYVEDSYLDSLTRLLNKKTITEYAQRAVEGSGKLLALAVMDIDNFKNVNDSYGHLFGDQVIHQTAEILKKVLGKHGVAGRIGGDEFMFLLEDFEDEVALRNYLRSIKQNMGTLFRDKMADNPLSCSIGVARNDIVTGEFKELFMTADKALYVAKQKGKNRYVIYKPELHGQFNVSDNSRDDMLEIRKSYYSDEDVRKIDELLSSAVIYGKECFPALLNHALRTLMVDRLSIFWGDETEYGAFSDECQIKQNTDKPLLLDKAFLADFEDDLYRMRNINGIESSAPNAYRIFKSGGVLSATQYLLRDENGEIKGLVSADECQIIRSFPKIALQIFINMCKIINGILIRDEK